MSASLINLSTLESHLWESANILRGQLWAYAAASKREQAHIAYLRFGQLHTFSAADLGAVELETNELVARIRREEYQPTPSMTVCGQCSYSEICSLRYVEGEDSES
ncbi:MAG: PD-(D/E)XK nuclease family protein [Acidobacteriota bacterium]|nr:PD-(D/E)XK nuclease family protein [Acidobacteriota bacterium]